MNWLTRWWDFIDKRDVDKHVVCWVMIYGGVIETQWAMAFAASNAARPGIDVAAIIGAVTAPYTLVMGAVIKWYFESRPQAL